MSYEILTNYSYSKIETLLDSNKVFIISNGILALESTNFGPNFYKILQKFL